MKKGLLILACVMIPFEAFSQDAYDFSNPSFSGDGWSSHVLTLEQMMQRSKQKERERIAAEQREIERELKNSNVNRFINNFESRVYAQLSKRLTDALFGENPSEYGSFDLAGNFVEYYNDGLEVSLVITDPKGSTTEITIPVGSLGL